MPAGAERSTQRDRRAGRDRHQHDPDLCEARQREQSANDDRDHRHRDQHRGERAQHRRRPLPDPAQVGDRDTDADAEHDRENGRRRDDRQHPFGDRPGHRPALWRCAPGGGRRIAAAPRVRVAAQSVSSRSPSATVAIVPAIASGMVSMTGTVLALAFLMVQFSATAYSPRLVQGLARSRSSGIRFGSSRRPSSMRWRRSAGSSEAAPATRRSSARGS